MDTTTPGLVVAALLAALWVDLLTHSNGGQLTAVACASGADMPDRGLHALHAPCSHRLHPPHVVGDLLLAPAGLAPPQPGKPLPRVITVQRKRANRRIVNEDAFLDLLREYAPVGWGTCYQLPAVLLRWVRFPAFCESAQIAYCLSGSQAVQPSLQSA